MNPRVLNPEETLPVMMGEKCIGRAQVDTKTGMMTATLLPEFAELLHQGFADNLLSVSFFGKPAHDEEMAQTQAMLKEYLEKP